MNRRPVLLPSASLSSPEFGPFLLYAPPDARNSDARIGPLKVDRIAVVYGRHHIVDLVPERIGVKAHAAAVVLHLICALVRSLRVLAHEIEQPCHRMPDDLRQSWQRFARREIDVVYFMVISPSTIVSLG